MIADTVRRLAKTGRAKRSSSWTISSDRTAEVTRRFASKEAAVVSDTEPWCCRGSRSWLPREEGDYIQWRDADDLLVPDKIERQLAALCEFDRRRKSLSSSWAYFNYRMRRARF